MRSFVICALALSSVLSASSQTRQPAAEDFGTVTGHILCGDTQRPARLAEVRLVPASISPTPASKTGKVNGLEDTSALGGSLPPIETDMSGAFTIRHVRPGQYYLRVDYGGYITPLLGFTRDQLAKPTPDIRQRIDRELQLITVLPHTTARVDATILRASAISGTVLYDDGTPAIGINISLFVRNAKGEFKDSFNAGQYFINTDDHGHYRVSSLPAGEYVVEANFAITESNITTMPTPGGGGGSMQVNLQKVLFDLPLYSGSVTRQRDASPIKTDAGQETSGIDLTFPLSKLHSVTGTVVAKDGHSINAGKVALLYADTREELTNVPIARDDNGFHFLYVPEGSYILAVQEASDITQVEVANPPGVNPRTHTEDKTLHTYGTVEQPLTVEGEQASVLATVPEKTQ